jgi:hypothetical protein
MTDLDPGKGIKNPALDPRLSGLFDLRISIANFYFNVVQLVCDVYVHNTYN